MNYPILVEFLCGPLFLMRTRIKALVMTTLDRWLRRPAARFAIHDEDFCWHRRKPPPIADDPPERCVREEKMAIRGHCEPLDRPLHDLGSSALKFFRKSEWPNVTQDELLCLMQPANRFGFQIRVLAIGTWTLNRDIFVGDTAALVCAFQEFNGGLSKIGLRGLHDSSRAISEQDAVQLASLLRSVSSRFGMPVVAIAQPAVGAIESLRGVLRQCLFELTTREKRARRGFSYKVTRMKKLNFRGRFLDVDRILGMLDYDELLSTAVAAAVEKPVVEKEHRLPAVKRPADSSAQDSSGDDVGSKRRRLECSFGQPSRLKCPDQSVCDLHNAGPNRFDYKIKLK